MATNIYRESDFHEGKGRLMDKHIKHFIVVLMVALALGAGCAQTESHEPEVGKGKIIITAPAGGERWITNEKHNITWKTTSKISKVTIVYSIDNFVNDIQTIATSIPNAGTFK